MNFRVVVMGAPGSGKSTLARRLIAANPGMASFGVRRYFADQMALMTPLGRAAKPFAEADRWLPDPLVIAAVRHEFEQGAFDSGFVFEGVPARFGQARLLDLLLAELGIPLTAVLHIKASDEVCLARAARRTVCNACDHGSAQAVEDPLRPGHCRACGGPIVRRPNDTRELMSERLVLHRRQLPRLLAYYRHDTRLVQIDGRLAADEVYATAVAEIEARLGAPHGAAGRS